MARKNGRMVIELDWAKDGKPFLRLVAANGEVLMSGETRSRPSGARETAQRIVDAGLRGFEFVELPKPKRPATRFIAGCEIIPFERRKKATR